MRRSITAIVAAASFATAVIAAPKPAEAQCWGCWVGAGIAVGLIGSAMISSSYGGYGPYYGYPAYYGYPRGYYAPRFYYGGYYGPRRYYAARVYGGYAPRYYARRYYARRY